MNTEELLTVDEAAHLMKMSPRHVRRLVQERRIGFRRLGRCVRFTTADVTAYVDGSLVEPVSELGDWRRVG